MQTEEQTESYISEADLIGGLIHNAMRWAETGALSEGKESKLLAAGGAAALGGLALRTAQDSILSIEQAKTIQAFVYAYVGLE